MKNKLIAYIFLTPVIFTAFISCKKDFNDPSGPSSEQAFNSPNALTDVAVGLQNWYTAGRGGLVYNVISTNGLLTGELYVVNAGNTDEAQFGTGGGAVQNTNVMITGTWSVCNKIIYDANRIIAQTNLIVADKNYASGLIAYTSIFKALAIANMAMFWEQVPDDVSNNFSTPVPFITNTEAYNRAINVLDSAIALVNATPISSSFLKNIPAGMNIINTLYALKARYALFTKQYALALDAANKVELSVKSTFNYSQINTNPIFTLATATNNIYQPVDSTMGLPAGLQPDLADKREPFYIAINLTPSRYFKINGFFNSTTTPIPVYLPGEIMLIKAECYARQNNLINGKAWLDSVVTKTPTQDIFGVGAGLPPTNIASQEDLLNQIYKHRCIELFMSGLKLADMRRFERPLSERKRNYLPYPFVERNDNPNTPPDPSF